MTDFKDGDRVRIAEGATFSGDEGVIPSVGDGQEGVVEWGWAQGMTDDGDVRIRLGSGNVTWAHCSFLTKVAPYEDLRAEMNEVLDEVQHPQHYQSASGLEVIDVIEGFDLNFRLANATKYILRAGKKGSEVDAVKDLRKGIAYINREINAREGRASW